MSRKKKEQPKARRSYGTGSIVHRERTRKDGTIQDYYEGKVSLGVDKNGKRIQKSVTGVTREEVQKKITEILYRQNHSNSRDKNCEQASMSLCVWYEKWVSEDANLAESTRTLYRSYYRLYIDRFLGHKEIGALTDADFRDWVNQMKDPKNAIRKALSSKTLRNIVTALSSCLTEAVEREYIERHDCNVSKLLGRKKGSRRQYVPKLTEDDIRKFLENIKGSAYENFYRFALFFGLREMENLGLTQSDIDFERHVIHLRFQLRRNLEEHIEPEETLHFKFLKDYEMRDIYFGDEIAELLKKQIASEKEKKKRLGKAWPSAELERGDLLFSNADGSYRSRQTIYCDFKRRMKQLGLVKEGEPSPTIHDLRHAYIMLALQSGDSAQVVADHVGHSDPTFTLNVYAYLTDEAKRKNVSNIGNMIRELDDYGSPVGNFERDT